MQCYSLIYENKEKLFEFISKNKLTNFENILIQVFTGINEYDYIEKLQHTLLEVLPNAKIIGATTSGEILQDQIYDGSTVISISTFLHTKILTTIEYFENSSFELGFNMMQSIQKKALHEKEALKVVISFTDGLNTNAEEYLKGLASVNNEVTVAGGMAGDNSLFIQTYVFNERHISSKGAVSAALFNSKLCVHTDYNFSWQTLGKSHTVQKSDKNRVYLIDNKTAVEFYAYYLGEDIANMLPAVGIEFPIVIQKDGLNIARAVTQKYPDGSLGFAGNVKQGSKIKFGYGNIQLILNQGLLKAERLAQKPIESIFVYSCMARKFLLKEEISNEIKPLQAIAPTSGFFTYGEFFYAHKNTRLLNQSMTILALSENPHKVSKTTKEEQKPFKGQEHLDFHRIQALSHLIGKTSNELEELNATLEKRVHEEVQKSLEKDAILFANARHAQMGEILDMIVHQWRQPLNVFSAGVSSLQVYNTMGLLTDDVFEKTTQQILNNVEFLNDTIKDFRNFFKNSQLKEHIHIDAVVEKSLVLLEPLIKKFGITFIKEITFEKELYICARELIQVLLNIFKNSMDAIEENGIKSSQIHLRIFEENKECVIEISDNAGGIPPELLSSIFEKRFTTKGESHGTGIGLDMSKTLIEKRFQGTLTARNNEHGATFAIRIPLNLNL
ncbi:MAG: FIST N-terminal domain-containing protein [Arcobacteraceae bacterium]